MGLSIHRIHRANSLNNSPCHVQLARRLFYSFAKPNSDYLHLEDIARYFPTAEEAEHVFALFDKEMNGDVSRDEMEMACL